MPCLVLFSDKVAKYLGTLKTNEKLAGELDSLSDRQLEFLRDCVLPIDSRANRKPVFLTGKAGTGKSRVIRTLISLLRMLNSYGNRVFVTATTGVAASTIDQAMTIHSFLGISGELDGQAMRGITENTSGHAFKRISGTGVLIIDEISMMSASFLDNLDKLFREAKRITNSTSCSMPFGGVKVICVGDFFQLAPVIRRNADAAAGNADATNHPGSLQETPEDERVWAFEARCWQHFQIVSL